jgi:K+-transporting ATPase ATPase C chain
MKNLFRPAVSLLLAMTLLTGVLYPLLVTLLAQAVFPHQANGSLLHKGQTVVGSSLIGQPFSGAAYFWSRPSATSPMPYNAANSGGSNLGPTNPALVDAVKGRIKDLRAAHSEQSAHQTAQQTAHQTDPLPLDLVTASASGLDPHISPAAAEFQVQRVARARQLDPLRVKKLVQQATEAPQWGVFGDSHVNVLQLNLALDQEAAR